VFDAKRLIGRRFADAQVGEDAKLWPFRLVPSARAGEDPANAGCVIEVQHKGETRRFAPEEISAMVRRDAIARAGSADRAARSAVRLLALRAWAHLPSCVSPRRAVCLIR